MKKLKLTSAEKDKLINNLAICLEGFVNELGRQGITDKDLLVYLEHSSEKETLKLLRKSGWCDGWKTEN
jgi:hypothetical protein